MKEFSDILRELRKKENLSQEALGNIIHVSRSAIAKYVISRNSIGYTPPNQNILYRAYIIANIMPFGNQRIWRFSGLSFVGFAQFFVCATTLYPAEWEHYTINVACFQ